MKLLDKIVPNLQSAELAVTEQTPFAVLPAQLEDATQWEDTFKPKTEH